MLNLWTTHWNTLIYLFGICKKQNVKYSTEMFTLQKKVKWCGLIISEKGYKMYPHNIENVRNMTFPKTADKLCPFMYFCG